MQLRMRATAGCAAPAARRVSAVALRPQRRCAVTVKADASVAWDAWEPRLRARGALPKVTSEAAKYAEIAAQIGKVSKGYKPKFSTPEPHSAALKVAHVEKVKIKELPKDLHDKLETIGVAVLESSLGLSQLDYLNASYTTTDIDAALSVTGSIIQNGTEKTAALAFVVTETEREASWSRLEGLILHWACTPEAGGPWNMPPDGWVASPAKTRDAGGAIQAAFTKQNVGGNEQMYVLVLQLPLRGTLRTGGPVFVLKGTANQTDRWLKDQATDRDFFLDLQTLPVTTA